MSHNTTTHQDAKLANDIQLEHADADIKRDEMQYVADTEAAAYIDSTIHISDAENKRLRRIIFTK